MFLKIWLIYAPVKDNMHVQTVQFDKLLSHEWEFLFNDGVHYLNGSTMLVLLTPFLQQ